MRQPLYRETAGSDSGEDDGSDRIAAYAEAEKATYHFVNNSDFYHDKNQRLRIAQALLVEFRVCAPVGFQVNKGEKTLPGTITAAKALIKQKIHINIKKYLEMKKSGAVVYGQIKMFKSRNALAKSIVATKSFCALSVVKGEMLEPLLVEVFHFKNSANNQNTADRQTN